MFVRTTTSSVPQIRNMGPVMTAVGLHDEEEEFSTACEVEKLMPIDRLFERLVTAGKITPECSWPEAISASLFGDLESALKRSHVCFKWLSSLRTVKANDGSFEITFSCLDLFNELGISDFYIIGSSILGKVLGRKCIQQAFASQGIPSITDEMPKKNLDEIFHSNDIDFRCFVSNPPDSYTKGIVRYLASKLTADPELSLHCREELVRAKVISEFYRSPVDSPYRFAMVSFGACDFFFSQGQLERNYLYRSDAWRAHCRYTPSQFELMLEGDFNGGWDSLLLQMMRVLNTEKVEAINFPGVISFFHQYTKGKRPLSGTIESEFIERYHLLTRDLGPEKSQELWLKSIEKHFSSQPEAALIVALNMTFLLEEYPVKKSVGIDLQKALLEPSLLPLPANQPVLQLLHSLFSGPRALQFECKDFLSSFLQLFVHLHCVQKQKVSDQCKMEFFVRKYGARPAFVIKWDDGNLPLHLVVGGHLHAALLKIKSFYASHDQAKDLFEQLHQLYILFLPAPTAEADLSIRNPNYDADPLYSGNGLEANCQEEQSVQDHGVEAFAFEALEMLHFSSPLFQQLGFMLLCYDGIIRRSSTHFPSLMRQLPVLLVHEKSAALRQQLFAHFMQYVLHTSRWGRFLPHCAQLQELYALIGGKHVTAQERLACFLNTFTQVDLVDCAAAACAAWKESSKLAPAACDYVLGGTLLKLLAPKYAAEFLRVFQDILKISPDPYRKLSALFFQAMTMSPQWNHQTATALSRAGQGLIHKAVTNTQLPLVDQKRFFDLAKAILIQSPGDGLELLFLLEKRQLLPMAFRNIICDQTIAKQGRAELLLLWIEKTFNNQPLHSVRASLLEERADLLLEGYALTLPIEVAEKLANWIACLLLECEAQKHSLSRRMLEKLSTRGRWIFDMICNLAEKQGSAPHLHCRFLGAMQNFGLRLMLHQADLDRLRRDLSQLVHERGRLDLVCNLLPMHDGLSMELSFLSILVNMLQAAAKFDLSEIYLQKLASLAEIFDPSLFLHVSNCMEGLLQIDLPLKAYRLFLTFAKKQLFLITANLTDTLPDLVAALVAENPKEAMQLLIDFFQHFSLSKRSPLIITSAENTVLKMLPQLPKVAQGNSRHEKKWATTALNSAEASVPFAQITLYQGIYALLAQYQIRSPHIWREVMKSFPSRWDLPTGEALIFLFKEFSETETWNAFERDKALCWKDFIPFMACGSVKCVDFLLSHRQTLLSLFLDHLPKKLHQETLSALTQALLSMAQSPATDIEGSNELALGAKAVELEMERRGLEIELPGHLLQWMSVFLLAPTFEVMVSFWECGNHVLQTYRNEKAWQLVDDLESLMQKSFVHIKPFSSHELERISPKICAHVEILLSFESKAAFSRHFLCYFYWLAEMKLSFLLPLEMVLAERIFGETSLNPPDKFAIKALEGVMERLMHPRSKTQAFEFMNKEFFPQSSALAHKKKLLKFYFEDPLLSHHLQQTQEALSLVFSILDAESSFDAIEGLMPCAVDHILGLYFMHDRIDILQHMMLRMMKFIFSRWEYALPHLSDLTEYIKNTLTALEDFCKMTDLFKFKHLELLFDIIDIDINHFKPYPYTITSAQFCSFTTMLIRKLNCVYTKTAQQQHFVDLNVFFYFHMMMKINPENYALHEELIGSFVLHPLASGVKANEAWVYALFNKIRACLIMTLLHNSLPNLGNKTALKFKLLLGDYLYLAIEISAEEKLDVMMGMIAKLVENSSIADLHTAITLLSTYQGKIFASYPLELSKCYDLIYSKMGRSSNTIFADDRMGTLFFTAFTNIPNVLPYSLEFSEAMLRNGKTNMESNHDIGK